MRFVFFLKNYLTFKLISWLKGLCGSLAHCFTVTNFSICCIYLEKKPTSWVCKSNFEKKRISKGSPSRKEAHPRALKRKEANPRALKRKDTHGLLLEVLQAVSHILLKGSYVSFCRFVYAVFGSLLNTGLPRSLKILESPGIGKRKFQALESPLIWVVVLENPRMGKILPLSVKDNETELFVITG